MMQERVREAERAQINGVQVSVSQLFMIFVSVFAMIWSKTTDFYILVFLTLGMILAACIVYTMWYCCNCTRRRRSSWERE